MKNQVAFVFASLAIGKRQSVLLDVTTAPPIDKIRLLKEHFSEEAIFCTREIHIGKGQFQFIIQWRGEELIQNMTVTYRARCAKLLSKKLLEELHLRPLLQQGNARPHAAWRTDDVLSNAYRARCAKHLSKKLFKELHLRPLLQQDNARPRATWSTKDVFFLCNLRLNTSSI